MGYSILLDLLTDSLVLPLGSVRCGPSNAKISPSS